MIETTESLKTPQARSDISGQKSSNHRPDIDGLRAIAIISVIAFHADLGFFSGGFVGVDVFFVISGFLIGGIIYNEIRDGRFSYARFYQRRAKRILPALFAVLAFCYLVVPFMLSPHEAAEFARNSVATILSFSNIWFVHTTGYFSPASDQNPLLMTWSLGVEEQFYIIFPVLMMALMKFRRIGIAGPLLVLSAASFLLSVIGVSVSPTATFYLLPTRAWELGAGALLIVYQAQRGTGEFRASRFLSNSLSVLGIMLLGYADFCFTRHTSFPGARAAFPVFGTVLLLMTRESWINQHILAARPVVFLGLVSYSWYLWHWPLLAFARLSSEGVLDERMAMIIIIASLAAAIVSYHFVEQPFRNSAMPAVPLLKRYGLLSAAMLVPACVLSVTQGWPQRFGQLAGVETDVRSDSCLVSYGANSPNLSSHCAPDVPGANVVALLGDSHAASLAGGLRGLARKNGFELYELTKSSCPALSGVTRRMPDHPGHDSKCDSYNRGVLDFVRKDARVKIVVLAGFWSAPFSGESPGECFIGTSSLDRQISLAASQENLRTGLTREAQLLRAAGKQVIIVKDNPRFDFDPVKRVAINRIPLRHGLSTLLSGQPSLTTDMNEAPRLGPGEDGVASAILDGVAMNDSGIQVFDPKKALCNNAGCQYSDGEKLLYIDSQHLSAGGAVQALAGFHFPTLISGPRSQYQPELQKSGDEDAEKRLPNQTDSARISAF